MFERKLSVTEAGAWKRCRQEWAWRYREGLVPRRSAPRLNMGRMAHAGVAAILQQRLTAGAPDYTAMVWEVVQNEMKHYTDIMDVEKESLVSDYELAIQLVDRWSRLAPWSGQAMGEWKILQVEHKFEVPIPGCRNSLHGVFDLIFEDWRGAWIVEWKFPKLLKSTADVELSTQLAAYVWAARKLGYPVKGIMYAQSVARLPSQPDVNKNGSISRKDVYCDWDSYARFVREHGGNPADYADEMIPKLSGKKFYQLDELFYSNNRLEVVESQLRTISREIQSPRTELYFCESPMTCSMCAFKDLCLEVARGIDPADMIQAGFTTREERDQDAD